MARKLYVPITRSGSSIGASLLTQMFNRSYPSAFNLIAGFFDVLILLALLTILIVIVSVEPWSILLFIFVGGFNYWYRYVL